MKSFSVAIALIAPVQAGLRFGCSSLTIQRIDPVVEPGQTPSAHVHHIVGGNAFNASMTGDVGERGTCTTCEMAEDFSNYWTAVLYFKHPTNGSYHRVPVKNNAALAAGTTGGMTIYYTPGFRMTVGSPTTTTLDQAKGHIGLRFNCLQTLLNRGPEMVDFPDKPCPAGIFAVHHFPACWDGKNLDSPDHQSHMFNTIKYDGFTNAPACPASHPRSYASVDIRDCLGHNQVQQPVAVGHSQPLRLELRGNSGLWHAKKCLEASKTLIITLEMVITDPEFSSADYMFGWKGDSLQRAMNKSECFYDGCGSIKKQTMNIANQCTVKDFVGEQTDGWLAKLPGMEM
ncbi:hypothetical protein CIB48_g4763 [Xylaria polymorpha]|nr:hypothetical protein CIB48_g4763 [Xylaria polymorpha]